MLKPYRLLLLLPILLMSHLTLSAQSADSLLKGTWILRSFQNPDGSRDSANRPTIVFGDSNKASGASPCSIWHGAYQLSGSDSITIEWHYEDVRGGPCTQPYQVRFPEALKSAYHYERDDNYLNIYYSAPGQAGVLNFSRPYPLVRLINMIPGIATGGIALYSDQQTPPLIDSVTSHSTDWWSYLLFGPHILRTALRTSDPPPLLTETPVNATVGSTYLLFLLGSSVTSIEPLLLNWTNPDTTSPSSQENTSFVRLLTASPEISVDRIWIEDVRDSLLAEVSPQEYRNVSEYQQVREGFYHLKLLVQGSSSVISYSGRFKPHSATTLILQREGDSLHCYALLDFLSEYREEPKWLEELPLTGIETSTFRIANLIGGAEAQECNLLFESSPYIYPYYGHDTLAFGNASAYYNDLPDTFQLAIPHNNWPVGAVPDSLTTLFIAGYGEQYWENNWRTVLRTPLRHSLTPGEARLRFLHALFGADTLDLVFRYSDGSRSRIAGIRFTESTPYASVPTGTVAITLVAAGTTTPLLDVEGDLPSGYLTIIADGSRSDSTLSLSLLVDSDSGAQSLHPFSPRTSSVSEELPDHAPILIVPNPAGTIAVVSCEVEQSEQMVVEIHDAAGRLMYRHEEMASAGVYQAMIPVAELVPGMYSVALHGALGNVYRSGRLVVVR